MASPIRELRQPLLLLLVSLHIFSATLSTALFSASPTYNVLPDGNTLPPPASLPGGVDTGNPSNSQPSPTLASPAATSKSGNYPYIAPEFVRAHNAVRSAIGEQPFSWDRKLAKHARRWSEQRRGDCQLIHSGSRLYGENMFWGVGWEWKASDAVKFWANEHLYYDPVHNTCEFDKVCGHFTQMVWNTSMKVGCGRSECYDGGVIITCNYYPPGNYLGERPF